VLKKLTELLILFSKDFSSKGNDKRQCNTCKYTMLYTMSRKKKKKLFYKMFQALECFPLKRIKFKQTTPDQSVSKDFMKEERDKARIPK